jgi:hypothetical protein
MKRATSKKQALPKQLLSSVLLAALLTSCGVTGAPMPPSLELPKPVTDLRAVRKGDKVYLAWTVPTQTTDRQTVRHLGPTRICRSLEITMSDCGAPVGEVPPSHVPRPSAPLAKPGSAAGKVQASYTDTLPQQLQQENLRAQIIYAVSVLNQSARSAGLSNQAHISALPAVPPPGGFHAEIAADGVRISWMCPSVFPPTLEGVQYRVRVYRRAEDSQTDNKVAEPDLMNCHEPQALDQTFEWEKTYYYRASVVTIIPKTDQPNIEIEGDDTPLVEVFAHDVFPPGVPSGLQAVSSGVGQAEFVDLIWAPVTDADLAGYNVYRHQEGGQPVKINSELVKTPAFRDTSVASGAKYLYSVSAVDLRGNESARSEEASEAVP